VINEPDTETLMPNILNEQIQQLKNFRLPGLDLGANLVYPYYDGCSLVNLPSSICQRLEVPGLGSPALKAGLLNGHNEALFNDHYKTVVVLLVDGLGVQWFQNYAASSWNDSSGPQVWEKILDDSYLGALTSVVPSTTSTALTTLWTGHTPAEHGILGYEVWLKEYGVIANMITHNPAMFVNDAGSLRKANFNPEAFLPVPALGSHLLQYNVKTYALLQNSIVKSGLSAMHFQDAHVTGFHTISDLFSNLRRLLSDLPSQQKTYVWAYWGMLDELSHHYGPDDERTLLEFNSFSIQFKYFLKEIKKKMGGNCLLLITADHGFVATPPAAQYELSAHPKFTSLLTMLPSGEARLPYLFLRSGRESLVHEYLHETWGDQFRVLESENALKAGLFGTGKPYSRTLERMGDWVVVPQGAAYWWWANKENVLHGRHGGLSSQEMLVPLVGIVL
jgi:hypothetical protein